MSVKPVFASGITRVQGNYRGSTTSGNFNVSLGSVPTVGNVIILAVGTSTTARSVARVNETGVAWWKQKSTAVKKDLEIWLGVVTSGGGDKNIVVTMSSTGSVNVGDACEYSGIVTSGYLDVTASTSGTGKNPATGATATTGSNVELWVGAVSNAGSDVQGSPTYGFSLLDGANQGGYFSLGFLECIIFSKGNANSSVTVANSDDYDGCICTFVGASQGPVCSAYATSSTENVTATVMSSYWYCLVDNLSGYIFSWNATSSFVNDTWAGFGGVNNTWANITKTVYAVLGSVVQWLVYANNSVNIWGVSARQNFTVTATVTFYFSSYGVLYRNGSSVSNASSVQYSSPTNLSLEGLANGNCSYLNMTWSDSSSTSNPVSFTVRFPESVWSYFTDFMSVWNLGNSSGYSSGWSAGNSTGWSAGNSTGYSAGWNAGNATGWASGNATGWANGNATGYTVGWAAGNGTGYSNGYNDGWALGNVSGYTQGWNDGNGTGWINGNDTGWISGNATGYSNGWNDGNASGYALGWNLGNVSGYSQGWNDGNSSGYSQGYNDGYNVGWIVGNTTGYGQGWNDGNASGYGQGWLDGNSAGYATGYSVGYSDGNATGYTTGWNDGNSTGYSIGYSDGWISGNATGYGQGWNDGNVTGYSTGWNDGNNTGFSNGWTLGNSTGYGQGWSDGNGTGYSTGYGTGYSVGYADGLAAGGGGNYIFASYTFTPSNPNVNQLVSFNASASNSSSPITTYIWDFGDGNVTIGSNTISHSYLLSGLHIYLCNLTVSNGVDNASFVSPVIVGASGTTSGSGSILFQPFEISMPDNIQTFFWTSNLTIPVTVINNLNTPFQSIFKYTVLDGQKKVVAAGESFVNASRNGRDSFEILLVSSSQPTQNYTVVLNTNSWLLTRTYTIDCSPAFILGNLNSTLIILLIVVVAVIIAISASAGKKKKTAPS